MYLIYQAWAYDHEGVHIVNLGIFADSAQADKLNHDLNHLQQYLENRAKAFCENSEYLEYRDVVSSYCRKLGIIDMGRGDWSDFFVSEVENYNEKFYDRMSKVRLKDFTP